MKVLKDAPLLLQSDDDFIQYVQHLCDESILKGPLSKEHPGWDVEDISGNINRVRRVKTQGDPSFSVIIKTVPAGGKLEKFPDIEFPINRLAYEASYAQWTKEATKTHPTLSTWVPQIFHQTEDQQILVLEDLSPAKSLQEILTAEKKSIPTEAFYKTFGTQLARFHRWSIDDSTFSFHRWKMNPSASANRPYTLTQPFEGASSLHAFWRENPHQIQLATLQKEFLSEYQKYLYPKAKILLESFLESEWTVLTHGDLHGASVFIQGENIPTLIDAELCDVGGAWFDVGMITAHLWMLSTSQKTSPFVPQFLESYWREFTRSLPALARSTTRRTDFFKKTGQFAGFEMIRRIIGAANSDYLSDTQLKENLLEHASQRILSTKKQIDADDFDFNISL